MNQISSGNSYTERINTKNRWVYRKVFAKERRYQYFNEYLHNKFLQEIAIGSVANIISSNHVGQTIDYEVHKPSPVTNEYAKKYLSLISALHRSARGAVGLTKLLASQPMVDIEVYSRTYINRIDAFV